MALALAVAVGDVAGADADELGRLGGTLVGMYDGSGVVADAGGATGSPIWGRCGTTASAVAATPAIATADTAVASAIR